MTSNPGSDTPRFTGPAAAAGAADAGREMLRGASHAHWNAWGEQWAPLPLKFELEPGGGGRTVFTTNRSPRNSGSLAGPDHPVGTL
eukprot:6347708-Pyramimonas_sp.AAC.1